LATFGFPEDVICTVLPGERGGDTPLAYTDGMIERRNEAFDRGQDRLRTQIPLLAHTDLNTALRELAQVVRDPGRDDDAPPRRPPSLTATHGHGRREVNRPAFRLPMSHMEWTSNCRTSPGPGLRASLLVCRIAL
jgi:hypothetical protein